MDLVHYGEVKKVSQQVNVHVAKTHFSKLLAKVLNGEEITIARAGKPVAKLIPIAVRPLKREWKPDPLLKEWAELDWFAPDPEIEKMFYGDDE